MTIILIDEFIGCEIAAELKIATKRAATKIH